MAVGSWRQVVSLRWQCVADGSQQGGCCSVVSWLASNQLMKMVADGGG